MDKPLIPVRGYAICEEKSVEGLVDRVKGMMAEGWLPTGGITVLPGMLGSMVFAQSMAFIADMTEEQAVEMQNRKKSRLLV